MSEQSYRLVANIRNSDGDELEISGGPMPKAIAEVWLEYANNQSRPGISIRHHIEPVELAMSEREASGTG